MSDFRKIGVVGLGTMGAGIAEVMAGGAYDVMGIEVNEAALASGRGHLERSTGRAVKRGRLTEEAQAALLDRITLSTDYAALRDCDLVIEAVPERLELKRRVFAELDRVCRPDAVLATNTSSLSVTEIAVTTGRPAAVVGVHFFNPAPVMRLVEVIGTVLTEPGHVARVAELVSGLGKVPVTIGDRAGFIANRLLFGYLNQAVGIYDSGHATREDIDNAMKAGAGLPMGPLTLLDLIGLDTSLEVLEAIYRETRDRRHAPAPILRRLVTAGQLGRKTGRGLYTYDRPGSPVVVDGPSPVSSPPASEEAAVPERPLVGVAGSGDVAVGIALRAARAGCPVRFVAAEGAGDAGTLTEDAGDAGTGADAAWRSLQASLDRAVAAGELHEAGRTAALDRITVGSEPGALAECDLVIESVTGDDAARRSTIAVLDGVAKPGAVLATTAATLPVIEFATATSRPGDVVGLHFAEAGRNLAEVVSTVLTDPGVELRVVALAERLGNEAVRCRDRAGFIVDALRFPYLNDAVRMMDAGYADADAIDAAMTLGCGYPVGPIADLDRLGLDRAVRVLRALHGESRETASAPAALLAEYATAGRTLR
ncbi:3-hydroxybutyryl-CoA dehydrogenase [Actinomadura sp. HBU206391]|uniref:3-hydroxybutyryl-CoA dehydrogenase n=1 Tax=Actinomadura sp. HBU206391 TaxID=2731692 RepID=UPI00164FC38D|nr:3-hydroxybutyryl-CoA dehydrogenase [Actinomadura sp. HBU206391]MBC6458036.1 3-hydroxybutyryl-CoA dehydrogenase [Actinomadura sp. HBU206391]